MRGPLGKIAISFAVWLGCLPKHCAEDTPKDPPQPWAERHPELEEQLLKTKRCEGCQLGSVEMSGKDLRGAALHKASLHGNLRGVDLRGADLRDAYLKGDLRGADLRGAKLDQAQLTGDFEGADLRGVSLRDARLLRSRFARARLEGVDLRSVRGAESSDFSYAILRGTTLESVSFVGTEGEWRRPKSQGWAHVPTGGTSLRGADLREANLRSAILSRCDLRDADLRGANLTDAVLPVIAEDMENAKFGGAVGPWGLRCAESSLHRCIPVGTPEEFRAMKKRMKKACENPGWGLCRP